MLELKREIFEFFKKIEVFIIMCGIVGLFSSNTIEGNQISLVNKMNDTLIHRGLILMVFILPIIR